MIVSDELKAKILAEPDPVKKWTIALRSGEFKQGRNALANDEGEFCCLGVACEIYSWENPRSGWVDNGEYRLWFSDGNGDEQNGSLPESVMNWLSLNDSEGAFASNEESLANVNDCGVGGFPEIAEIIDSRPEELFAK